MYKKLDTQKHPLLFLIPTAIGLFFTIFGLYLIHTDRQRAARCTAEVTGVVAEMLESQGNGGTVYTPVFEYRYDGEDFRQDYCGKRFFGYAFGTGIFQ